MAIWDGYMPRAREVLVPVWLPYDQHVVSVTIESDGFRYVAVPAGVVMERRDIPTPYFWLGADAEGVR